MDSFAVLFYDKICWEMIKIVECPRDAMQGWKDFIPTSMKIRYINALLKVGFDTIDCGSFVSPKLIPQLRDTEETLKGLDLRNTASKLSVIVGNLKGAQRAVDFEQVDFLGFPFSTSETFQRRNLNKSVRESFELIGSLRTLTAARGKKLSVYISMAFGNPYGDLWSLEEMVAWIAEIVDLGVDRIALSDTVGLADLKDIRCLFASIRRKHPQLEVGAHFHTRYAEWRDKVATAYEAGCRLFDGVIRGKGGCPMAKDELVGNMPTEKLIAFAQEQKETLNLDLYAFESAYNQTMEVFSG